MGITSDSRVDDYIAGLPQWQRAVCQQLRDLVHRADPEIEETIKFGNRPYFVLKGNVCALLAARNHVCLFLYDGAIVPDPHGIITGGHDNETARQISFFEGDSVNREALLEMLKQIVANNRAGGWRKLKRSLEQRLGLVGDQAGERQRRGRGRRGGVADEQRALGARDEEVVDQRAVAGERLGADPGGPGDEVGGAQSPGPAAAPPRPARASRPRARARSRRRARSAAPGARSRARRASRAGRRRAPAPSR